MGNRRIIYLLEPFQFPAGGVATIYRHVEILNSHGMPAVVALSKRPSRDFYDTTAPLLIHGAKFKMEARTGDIFVIPEGFPDHVKALMGTPAKRLMFCQNQYNLPFSTNAQASVDEFNVHGIIASSEAVRNFFKNVYRIPDLPILPYAIDPVRFRPAARKERRVAFMPRKLPHEAAFIASVFKRRYPRHVRVPWIAIQNVSVSQAAAMMAESDVFLSLSHRESFGLPPLEAMACGCLVAGYHGDGGREYMNETNGWWAETGNWKAATEGLAAALDLLEAGGPELDLRRQEMISTVKRYSPARLESALIAFWKKELETQ